MPRIRDLFPLLSLALFLLAQDKGLTANDDNPDTDIVITIAASNNASSKPQPPLAHRNFQPVIEDADYIFSGSITSADDRGNVTLKVASVFKGDKKKLKDSVTGKALTGGCLPNPRYAKENVGKTAFLSAKCIGAEAVRFSPIEIIGQSGKHLQADTDSKKIAEYLNDYINDRIAKRVLAGEFTQPILEDLKPEKEEDQKALKLFMEHAVDNPETLKNLTITYQHCAPMGHGKHQWDMRKPEKKNGRLWQWHRCDGGSILSHIARSKDGLLAVKTLRKYFDATKAEMSKKEGDFSIRALLAAEFLIELRDIAILPELRTLLSRSENVHAVTAIADLLIHSDKEEYRDSVAAALKRFKLDMVCDFIVEEYTPILIKELGKEDKWGSHASVRSQLKAFAAREPTVFEEVILGLKENQDLMHANKFLVQLGEDLASNPKQYCLLRGERLKKLTDKVAEIVK